MVTKTIITRTGYVISIQNINNDVNYIYISDGNLYPDEDSRSKERREWIFPINEKKTMIEIAETILDLYK